METQNRTGVQRLHHPWCDAHGDKDDHALILSTLALHNPFLKEHRLFLGYSLSRTQDNRALSWFAAVSRAKNNLTQY